jgi:hypothetical protein
MLYLIKKFAIVIFISILVGSLFGAFHHHDDGLEHQDCAICVFNITAKQIEIPPVVAAFIPNSAENNVIIHYQSFIKESTRPFNTLANAPPLS